MGRSARYCDKTDVPLQIEHIQPKARGGTEPCKNLALACEKCNTNKGDKPVEEFLKSKPEVLERILKHAKASLKDAAAVNATRWELYRRLQETGMPVETGSGGRTSGIAPGSTSPRPTRSTHSALET